jgi:hypothetical protein
MGSLLAGGTRRRRAPAESRGTATTRARFHRPYLRKYEHGLRAWIILAWLWSLR